MIGRPLGNTGLELSTFSFGAAGIGNLYREVSREDTMATLETAWEAGIRYFDTAPHYGHGLSERRLGDFLRDKPKGSYVLSSKVGRLLKPVAEEDIPDHGFVRPLPFAVVHDYTYDGIMRSYQDSLARLGLNGIDILTSTISKRPRSVRIMIAILQILSKVVHGRLRNSRQAAQSRPLALA